MKQLKIVSVAVLALLTLIVVLQNTGPVETRILFFTLHAPVALLLFVTGVLGFVLGVAVSLILRRRVKPPAADQGSPPPREMQP
ncbi:MAG: LapA family protein [Deltaproteobacteria bacterium]|nr:LapA family protein [Deltaproteobacteria bacterium]